MVSTRTLTDDNDAFVAPTIGPEVGDWRVDGRGGNDTLVGMDGNDTFWGGDGDDIITGGIGFDDLYGGDGDDTIYGDQDADYLAGRGKRAVHGRSVVILSGREECGWRGGDARIGRTQRGAVQLREL